LFGGEITIYESNVQGDKTVYDMMHCIDVANLEKKCDILMIIRGGGAKTDLEDFNDYELAVKIKHSKIPIVCGIGHEIDRTIVDDVADHSFITPTDAAESISCGNCESTDELNSVIRKYNQLMQVTLHKYDKCLTTLNDFNCYACQLYDMVFGNCISKYNSIIDGIVDKTDTYLKIIKQYPTIIEKCYENDIAILSGQILSSYQRVSNMVLNYDKQITSVMQPKILIEDKILSTKEEFLRVVY
jgi:exonuclease VII large subunit